MGIREGRWRCPRCNSENLGRFMECSGCGDTRDDEVEFYLPDGEPEVSDEALLARARAGTDKLCEFCDASNPPDATICQGCSAPLTERSREEKFEAVEKAPAEAPQPEPQPLASKKQPSRIGKFGCIGCLTILAAVALAAIVGRFVQREATLTVIGVAWERSFEVERSVTVTKTGWQGELPAAARPRSSRRAVKEYRQVQVGSETVIEKESYREQVGTEKVKVGTRDLGNGFFEDVFEDRPVYENRTRDKKVTRPVYEKEAIYGTEVSYDIDEWQVVRKAENRGNDLEAVWPSMQSGEREKKGSRSESYTVSLRDKKGKIYTKEASEATFQLYRLGSAHTARIDTFGTIRSIRPKR